MSISLRWLQRAIIDDFGTLQGWGWRMCFGSLMEWGRFQDVEKHAPKLGVISQSVKEVVQVLKIHIFNTITRLMWQLILCGWSNTVARWWWSYTPREDRSIQLLLVRLLASRSDANQFFLTWTNDSLQKQMLFPSCNCFESWFMMQVFSKWSCRQGGFGCFPAITYTSEFMHRLRIYVLT